MEQQRIINGGVQYVPQIAVQYVYLDFDGELTSYNGEILTIDGVEVLDSSLTGERIADIVAELNALYADQSVIFVTEKPTVAEYSTIFVGKTSAFDAYGNFAGLAETIDHGNEIKNDNAFVMLDSTASNEAIISTICHETDHLLGTLDHGGSGLNVYACTEYYFNRTLTGDVNNWIRLSKSEINHSSSECFKEQCTTYYSYHYDSARNATIYSILDVSSGGNFIHVSPGKNGTVITGYFDLSMAKCNT